MTESLSKELRDAVADRLFEDDRWAKPSDIELPCESMHRLGPMADAALAGVAAFLDKRDLLLGPKGLMRVGYACRSCGYHPESRSNWCAKGCGRDYNQMFERLLLVSSEEDS